LGWLKAEVVACRDRIGLELGTENKCQFHVEEDDPLSTVNELRRTWTMSRDDWDGKETAFSICKCVDLRIAPSS
jgi:hypothetical protein